MNKISFIEPLSERLEEKAVLLANLAVADYMEHEASALCIRAALDALELARIVGAAEYHPHAFTPLSCLIKNQEIK